MEFKPLISIVIPTLYSRGEMLKELLQEFNSQLHALNKHYLGCDKINSNITRYKWIDTEILTFTDKKNLKIGKKRNALMDCVTGVFCAHFDDDDFPSNNYFQSLFKAIEEVPDLDCCSLRGTMTTNGLDPVDFEHSLKYTKYQTNDSGIIRHERYPNHLNLIRTDIAKQFKFPEINVGEDTSFAHQLFESKLLKKEYYINHVIYFYRYINYKV